MNYSNLTSVVAKNPCKEAIAAPFIHGFLTLAGLFGMFANSYGVVLIRMVSTINPVVKFLMGAQCLVNLLQNFYLLFYFGPVFFLRGTGSRYIYAPFMTVLALFVSTSYYIQVILAVQRLVVFLFSVERANTWFTMKRTMITLFLPMIILVAATVWDHAARCLLSSHCRHFDPCRLTYVTGRSAAPQMVQAIRKFFLGIRNAEVYATVAMYVVIIVKIRYMRAKKSNQDAVAAKKEKYEIRIALQFGIVALLQLAQIVLQNIFRQAGRYRLHKHYAFEAVKWLLSVADPLLYVTLTREMRRMFLKHIGRNAQVVPSTVAKTSTKSKHTKGSAPASAFEMRSGARG